MDGITHEFAFSHRKVNFRIVSIHTPDGLWDAKLSFDNGQWSVESLGQLFNTEDEAVSWARQFAMDMLG